MGVRVNGVNSSLIRWETARLSITRNRQKANQAAMRLRNACFICSLSVRGVGGIFLLNADQIDFPSHIAYYCKLEPQNFLLSPSSLSVHGEGCSLLLLVVNKNENV